MVNTVLYCNLLLVVNMGANRTRTDNNETQLHSAVHYSTVVTQSRLELMLLTGGTRVIPDPPTPSPATVSSLADDMLMLAFRMCAHLIVLKLDGLLNAATLLARPKELNINKSPLARLIRCSLPSEPSERCLATAMPWSLPVTKVVVLQLPVPTLQILAHTYPNIVLHVPPCHCLCDFTQENPTHHTSKYPRADQ